MHMLPMDLRRKFAMEAAKTSIDVRRAYGIVGRLHVADELHEAIFNGPLAMILVHRILNNDPTRNKLSTELWDAKEQLEDDNSELYHYINQFELHYVLTHEHLM